MQQKVPSHLDHSAPTVKFFLYSFPCFVYVRCSVRVSFQKIWQPLVLHLGFTAIYYLYWYEKVCRARASSVWRGPLGIVPITQTRTRWGLGLGLARARGNQEEGEPGSSVLVGAGGWAQRVAGSAGR